MSKLRMYESKNPRGSVAVMVLIVITIGMLGSILPGKQGPFMIAVTIVTYIIILVAEGILFSRVHYGDKPKDVWQRAKTDA